MPIGSARLVTCKRKRISEQQIAEYLSLLRALPIRVEPQGLWANVDLESMARRQNVAAYDAAYPEAMDTNKSRIGRGPR